MNRHLAAFLTLVAVSHGVVGAHAQDKTPAPLSPAGDSTVAPTEPAEAAEPAVNGTTVTYEVDFNTRYVYRGLALSEGPVIQPGLYAARRGYTLGLWGNLNLSRRDGVAAGPRQLNETDLSLVKSIGRGKTTLEPSVLLYFYPTNISPTTGEVSLKLARRFKSFSLYTSHTVDFLKYGGAYFAEMGLECDKEFSAHWSGAAKLSLGAGNGTFNEVNIGPRRRALNMAGLDLSLSRMLGEKVYVRPHIGVTRILDHELREALEDPTLMSLGVAIGGEF